MKSIKAKLILFLGILIGIICLGFGIVSYMSSSNALTSNLEKTLPNIAEQVANNISGRLKGELNSLEVVAARGDINNPNILLENKFPILQEESKLQWKK